MKPTNKLRFVERDGKKILQQWWEIANTINMGFGDINVTPPYGEWRDVSVEKETPNE